MRVRHILYLGFTFLFLNFAISYIATKTIPYLGFFSFPNLLESFRLPDFIKRFAGFDGLHYINIAQNGYEKNEVAFFPFYPLLIRLVASISTLSFPVAALFVSWASLMMVLLILPRYLSLIGLPKTSKWFLVFLAAFPTSFFLQAAYTESLFLLLVLLALFFNKRNKFLATILFAFLAGATRIVGVFLVIPLLFSGGSLKRRLPTLLAPILGLLAYTGYLWWATGDPLKFFHVQPQFGAGRTTQIVILPQVIYRYLKIFLTADINFTYFVAALEFSIFVFTLFVLSYDLYRIIKRKASGNPADRLGLNLFGWALLILPTVTGTLLSVPRFVLPILVLYLALAEIKSTKLKVAIAGIFSVLHIILLMFFIQGYFVS